MIVRNIINLASCFCFMLLLVACNKINPEELTGDYVYAEIDGKQYKTGELSFERPLLYIERVYKSVIGEEDYVSYCSSDIVLYQQQNTLFGTKRFYLCFDMDVLFQDESYPMIEYYQQGGTGHKRIKERGEDFIVFYEEPAYSKPNVGIKSAWVKIDRLDTVNHRAYGQFEIDCTKKDKSVKVSNGRFDIPYYEENEHYIRK